MYRSKSNHIFGTILYITKFIIIDKKVLGCCHYVFLNKENEKSNGGNGMQFNVFVNHKFLLHRIFEMAVGRKVIKISSKE